MGILGITSRAGLKLIKEKTYNYFKKKVPNRLLLLSQVFQVNYFFFC